MSSEITVRSGVEADLVDVLNLINELATFVGHSDKVENTVERMRLDGFGPKPIYGFFVAEHNGKIVGTSIYYYRYSTWKGKRLYLEDLVVSQAERGKGIGKRLFEVTLKKSLTENCSGIMWQVVSTNDRAIHFYKKYNTTFDTDFINCALEKAQITEILSA